MGDGTRLVDATKHIGVGSRIVAHIDAWIFRVELLHGTTHHRHIGMVFQIFYLHFKTLWHRDVVAIHARHEVGRDMAQTNIERLGESEVLHIGKNQKHVTKLTLPFLYRFVKSVCQWSIFDKYDLLWLNGLGCPHTGKRLVETF